MNHLYDGWDEKPYMVNDLAYVGVDGGEDQLWRDDDVKRVPDLEDDRRWRHQLQRVVGREPVPGHGQPEHGEVNLIGNPRNDFLPQPVPINPVSFQSAQLPRFSMCL